MSRRFPIRVVLAVLVGWIPAHSDRAASASGEQCDQSKIALIGHETGNGAMFRTAETLRDAGFADVRVGVAGVSNETDLVLVFVNATDGPMPGTRESIEELAGFDELPLALVLSNTDRVDDPELLQLVETESAELLDTNGLSPLAVLTPPAHDLVAEVRSLLGLPAGEPDASCDGPNEIVLVGQRDQLSLYVAAERMLDNDLGDVAIGVRDVSTSTELVLVVVSARAGLKQATRDAITELADLDVPRVALLITESSEATDQEQLDSVRLDAMEALTASGFDAVPVVMTEGWPTISTGVTAPYDGAFVAAVSALLDWTPGEPAPPDVQVTIAPPSDSSTPAST